MEIDTDHLVVSRLSVVPDGTLLFEQPEAPRFEKVHQFAESQSVVNPFSVYRQPGNCVIMLGARRNRTEAGLAEADQCKGYDDIVHIFL